MLGESLQLSLAFEPALGISSEFISQLSLSSSMVSLLRNQLVWPTFDWIPEELGNSPRSEFTKQCVATSMRYRQYLRRVPSASYE